jgi:hypothetical protein
MVVVSSFELTVPRHQNAQNRANDYGDSQERKKPRQNAPRKTWLDSFLPNRIIRRKTQLKSRKMPTFFTNVQLTVC